MRKESSSSTGSLSRRTYRRALETLADVSVARETAEQVVVVAPSEAIRMHTRGIGEAGLEVIGPYFLPKNTILDILLPEIPPPPHVDFAFDPGLRIKAVVRKVQMSDSEPEYSLWLHLTEIDDATRTAWNALINPQEGVASPVAPDSAPQWDSDMQALMEEANGATEPPQEDPASDAQEEHDGSV